MSAAAAAVPIGSLLTDDIVDWGREVHAAALGQPSTRGLDDATLGLLSPACERIIPADETPGAIAAGVPRFIQHMLVNWYDPPEQARVVEGLQALDRQARTRLGRPFVDLDERQQEALLLELDAQGPKSWFATVKYLTIWGYYTSEIGVKQELQQWPSPGRYDGCAPYAPRPRSTSQAAHVGFADRGASNVAD